MDRVSGHLVAEAPLRPRGAPRPVARGVRRAAEAARGARAREGMARHGTFLCPQLRPLRPGALLQPSGAPARGPERRLRPPARRPPRQAGAQPCGVAADRMPPPGVRAAPVAAVAWLPG